MIRLLVAMAVMAFAVTAASAAETSLQKGRSFFLARAALLRDGWKPIEAFEKFPNGDGEILHSWGDAESFYKHGYKEVASCSGTGENVCIFNYQKGGRCLFLGTVGEYGPPGARYVPAVNNWWTYPMPAKGGCSDDAAHAVKFTHFGQRSFP